MQEAAHADTAPENMLVIEKLARRLGLGLSNSPFRWASYVFSNTLETRESGVSGISSPRAALPGALRFAHKAAISVSRKVAYYVEPV